MSVAQPATKKQLLKVIDDLEASPSDRVRILGDFGITSVGVGLGAAAAGTVATIAGATAIPVVTSAASWLGMTAVAATPSGVGCRGGRWPVVRLAVRCISPDP